jgi:hypothetical protein
MVLKMVSRTDEMLMPTVSEEERTEQGAQVSTDFFLLGSPEQKN